MWVETTAHPKKTSWGVFSGKRKIAGVLVNHQIRGKSPLRFDFLGKSLYIIYYYYYLSMEFKFNNIGISGVAGCGKNTLSEIIIKLLQRLELPYRELSIAKKLKQEVSWASRELYGINSSNCTREEKDTIRPFLVAHGEIKRKLSNGTHWTSLLNKELTADKINIITDIRYNHYEKDEVFWLKNEINGVLIHLSRYDQINGERSYFLPANEAEKTNDPRLKAEADFVLKWKSDKEQIKKVISAEKLLKWVKKLYV